MLILNAARRTRPGNVWRTPPIDARGPLLHRTASIGLAIIVVVAGCSYLKPHPPTPAPPTEATPTVPHPADQAARPTPPPRESAVPPGDRLAEKPVSPAAAPAAVKARATNAEKPTSSGTDRAATVPAAEHGPSPAHAAGAANPIQRPVATMTLDLKSLEQRLRDTQAIGVFTKLSLKNGVDDLLNGFRTFHGGQVPPTLAELRQRYETLLMKVLTLLQDGDPSLASEVSSSRDAIWGILADRERFLKI